MKKGWTIGLFIVGLTIVLLYQYQKYRVAPTVDVFTLSCADTSGKEIRMNDYKGKKIIFSFAASWCGDCLLELKQLNETKKNNLQDVEVIVVSDESLEKIKLFAERKKYPFTFLKLNKTFSEINIHAIPVTYLINSSGEITYSKVGAINWKDNSVISFVNENLK